jgi:hypothetical protein
MSVAQSYSKVNNLIEEMQFAASNNSWDKYDELGIKHQYERMLLEEKQEKVYQKFDYFFNAFIIITAILIITAIILI